jgi:hypothetical protein
VARDGAEDGRVGGMAAGSENEREEQAHRLVGGMEDGVVIGLLVASL